MDIKIKTRTCDINICVTDTKLLTNSDMQQLIGIVSNLVLNEKEEQLLQYKDDETIVNEEEVGFRNIFEDGVTHVDNDDDIIATASEHTGIKRQPNNRKNKKL